MQFPLFFSLIPIFFLVLLKSYWKKHPFHVIIQSTKIPPGPWKLPLIGSIHQLITGVQTHHRFYRLAQKYGPLFHIKLGQVDFVVASSPSTACEVLKTHDHVLASRPTLLAVEKIGYNSSSIGFSPYGPYWRQLHNVIKETLRLHPPLPLLLPRTCNEPTSLSEFQIPKGARVVVNAWAIARDPKIWENPFGSGRRICPGMTFAMAGMELFLSLLLLHFDWEIPGGKGPMELDMEEEFDGTSRRKKDLYLIAKTHSL